MRKAVFVSLILTTALVCLGIAQDETPQAALQNRITPIDDGTVQLNMFESGIMFNGIDGLGSHLSRYQNNQNGSMAYLRFDLSRLVQVADQNLVMLKIYADNSRDLEDNLIILSGRMLSMKDGTSPEGFLMFTNRDSDVGSGFALFNVTDPVKTLQQHGPNDIAIFLSGDNMSIGTIESGKPAEIIVI